MEAKRLNDSELRNASAKKAKTVRDGQQLVNNIPEPQGLYAEFLEKHTVEHTHMQEWMKQVKQTCEELQLIRDPTDAEVNEICATAIIYGCTWNDIFALIIHAGVKDQKFTIDVDRISTSNVSTE